jgi:hypothetical protein
VLGEARAGVFKVLEAGGALNGSANSANWLVDTSAVTNASGFTFALFVQDDTLLLTITAKGTILLMK